MSAFTPEWAMAAYKRLISAQRDIPQADRDEAMLESERQQKRARLRRGYERVA